MLQLRRLHPDDLADLRRARELLVTSSLAIRLTDLLGKPIEKGLKILPQSARESIHEITRAALSRAVKVALATLQKGAAPVSSDRWHKLATAATGAAGGLFGLGGLALELPVTTVIMFRSIGDIARSEGHDLADPAVELECLSVFALGGPSRGDDAAETGYYAVRAGLAMAVTDAVRHLGQRGMMREGAPVLVRLIEAIAARFGLVVEEKVALEAVPLIGAVSGSIINTIFMEHYQNMARGHFIIRRLEKRYGDKLVREAFEGSWE